MTRQEIIDLIHNEYDAAPAHYKLGDNWDDGSGRIADAVLQRVEQLEAALRRAFDFLQDKSFMPDSLTHECTKVVEQIEAALAPGQEK